MGKKIVFFDIDGTLVNADKNMAQSTFNAIKHLQSNEVEVVLATGRPSFMFEDIRKQLEIDSYISFSGQYVVLNGEVVHSNPINADEVRRLHSESKARELPMIFMSGDKMKATVENHPFIYEGLEPLKFAYPKVDEMFAFDETIFQALLFCETGDEIELACPDGLSKFLRWHKYSLDVLPGNGHKAVGIEKLLDASGVYMENTFAFGDGPNDLEMIEAVSFGVAMGNAVPEVKAVADYVTEHVDNDGVVKGLEYLGLI